MTPNLRTNTHVHFLVENLDPLVQHLQGHVFVVLPGFTLVLRLRERGS